MTNWRAISKRIINNTNNSNNNDDDSDDCVLDIIVDFRQKASELLGVMMEESRWPGCGGRCHTATYWRTCSSETLSLSKFLVIKDILVFNVTLFEHLFYLRKVHRLCWFISQTSRYACALVFVPAKKSGRNKITEMYLFVWWMSCAYNSWALPLQMNQTWHCAAL